METRNRRSIIINQFILDINSPTLSICKMVIFKKQMIEKESNQKTILSEAFLSFSGMSLGSVFRYMFSIIMARFLGAQMLGLYSLGNAITRIAEIFALMGLDNGVLRFVSRDSEDKENVDRSIYSSLKIGLISSLLISTT